MKLRLVLCLLLLGLAALPATAAPLSPVEGLEAVRKAFSGIDTLSADITQEKQVSLLRKKMKASGVIRFRRPDRFYMELYSPSPMKLLLQDSLLTIVYPGEGVRQKVPLPPEESLRKWFALLAKPVTSVPEGVEVTAASQGEMVRLQVSPKGKGQVREFTLAVSTDGKVREIEIVEKNGDRTQLRFHRVRRNPPLSEADFRLD